MSDTHTPAPPDSVEVRMYRGLLGDCFLIEARGPDRARYILMDCGILQHIPDDEAKMQAVAADIAKVTGKHLDLLVITHEHHDHLSGFIHAHDVLLDDTEFIIDNLWLGWTEDPQDAKAAALKGRFDRRKRAVVAVAAAANRQSLQVTAGLQAFIAPLAEAADPKRLTGEMVFKHLKSKASAVNYLRPGEVRTTPGGLTAYVLGPPTNEDRLFQDLPAAGGRQAYLAVQASAAESLRAAAEGWFSGEAGDVSASPFAACYVIAADKVTAGGDPTLDWLKDAYYAAPSWRRVDADWLGAGSALALKLDRDTNNTSLVLAFELSEGGKVLLFAADAQIGNWLSWHDQSYPAPHGLVTAADLLARTRLYKVGHHCSHNATLQDKGLELMTSPDLVAMIPVVEADAKKQGTGWNMPYPALLSRLMERTKNRVLRGDAAVGDIIDPDPAFKGALRENGPGEPSFVAYRLTP